ncbi:MAG: site-specific DNA-methyltransferase [Candidatus Diapherotrites archaeon]|nr:site-specific DNA-methyltransferase [Candidatus Diapherotrites archaeon]
MISEKLGKFELNKAYSGDCIELTKKLPSDSIDLIVTSPPYADTVSYGNKVKVFNPDDYVDWFLDLSKQTHRVLKPSGSFILNINDKAKNGERSTYVFELVYKIAKETGLKLFDRYIWYKKSALPMTGEKRLNDRVEYIFHFVKDSKKFKTYTDRIREPYKEISLKRFKNKVHGNDIVLPDGTTKLSQRGSSKPHPLGTKPTTVFRFDTCSALRGLEHPAPFHPQLPAFFVNWLTDEKDVVLDPFIGGGTVAEVCMKMNRNFIGFDINKKYVEITEKRLKKTFSESSKKTSIKKVTDFC